MRKNKITLLIIVLFVFSISLPAQHEEPVLLHVHYQFTHVYDTNNRATPYTRGMVLHLGETNSKYTDGDAEAAYNAAMKESKNIPARAPIIVTGRYMATVSSINLDVIFQLPYENKLVTTARVGTTDFVIETPAPAIKWKIENETKKIEKYTCQKAVGVFGGRTYTVWFTTELPFKNGPWKLCGLPGLILEARDTNNEVAFICKEVFKGEPGEIIASKQVRPVKVNEKAFARARKMFNDDPASVSLSQMPNYKEPISVKYTAPSGKTYWNEEAREAIRNDRKVHNNPMELPGK